MVLLQWSVSYSFDDSRCLLIISWFAQNPLRFSFPPDLNEDSLMQGAEQLSSAVLKSGRYQLELLYKSSLMKSDPEVVQQSPDMTGQLTRRKERLCWLIGFINENVVLVKVR
jgi:nuclear pore complex protein Nup133